MNIKNLQTRLNCWAQHNGFASIEDLDQGALKKAAKDLQVDSGADLQTLRTQILDEQISATESLGQQTNSHGPAIPRASNPAPSVAASPAFARFAPVPADAGGNNTLAQLQAALKKPLSAEHIPQAALAKAGPAIQAAMDKTSDYADHYAPDYANESCAWSACYDDSMQMIGYQVMLKYEEWDPLFEGQGAQDLGQNKTGLLFFDGGMNLVNASIEKHGSVLQAQANTSSADGQDFNPLDEQYVAPTYEQDFNPPEDG